MKFPQKSKYLAFINIYYLYFINQKNLKFNRLKDNNIK